MHAKTTTFAFAFPLALLLSALSAFGQSPAQVGATQAEIDALPDGLYARVDTQRGTMVLALEQERAPLTVANFVGLAEGWLGPKPGAPFYDGLTFHRVVSEFVIQGGDPLGTGEGGPGHTFPDEFGPGLRHDAAGVLSMANSGPDTNGSQFFITLGETMRLNYLHSVFGRVVLGREVPGLVRRGDAMRVKILRRGERARAFASARAAFEALRDRARAYTGPTELGPGATFEDPDGVLPTDVPRARNFHFKLANFERATGVPVRAAVFGKKAGAELAAATGSLREARLAARAATLGLDRRGALAVYLAATGEWLLWASEPLAARLAKPGTPRAEAVAGACAEATQRGRSLAARADEAARKNGGAPLSEAMRVKYSVDAMLDFLLVAFEPKAEDGGRMR